MNFERYTQITDNAGAHIRPKQSFSLTFDGQGLENADRLFFTGETAVSYFWKSEPDYQVLYRRIDDSLRTDVARHDRYCLDMSGSRVSYTKLAYKRLDAPLRLSYLSLATLDDGWDFGITATAKDLRVYGFCRVTLEVRYRRDGVDNAFALGAPDEVFYIDIPEGGYDYRELTQHITIDSKNIASLGYFVEGRDYEGTLYLEEPCIKSCEGRNILVQFAPHSGDRPTHDWMGQNLSRLEQVDMKIDINGTTVFDGQVFERCHRFSEWEVSLERGVIVAGENTVTFTCLSDYRDAPGYDLREVGFVTNAPSTVVAVPENVTAGVPFYVLVDAPKGKKYDFSSGLVTPLCLECQNDGLNILTLVCDSPAGDVRFTLDGEEHTVSRCVLHGDDGVTTGTGDMIYIDTNEIPHKNYLKWYLSNNIGNLLTIRPTYRWCGTRTVNDAVWKSTAKLLDRAGIKYVHMIDGRELPGLNCNPPVDVIDSDSFLGRQTHEFDGQFCYWGSKSVDGDYTAQLFYDLYNRMYREEPERCNLRYVPEVIYYKKDVKKAFIDPDTPLDMKAACDKFVNSLKVTRKGNLRHTGPATLFKYFYQAGYTWTGAELMYSPTELTASALRGARDVYGGKTGAHLAVQWSSSPHDTESRYRRYRLALFICYMQDIDDINTEEGLWRLEEYYSYHNRFSPACVNHTKQQQDFYRYVSTHTRTGSFYTPIAFLSGRYDGWRCFSRGRNTWGVREFGFTEVESAWDILTFFYPKSVLNALYVHDCPDTPVGYYSGTPYGNVDITPIEAESFSKYRLLVACGYNCAETNDIQKFTDFVNGGGTLVIGWPQLSVTTDRRDVVACRHEYVDGKTRTFTPDSFNGAPLNVCADIDCDEVVLVTDGGRPLVVKKQMGLGAVYFVTAREYAGCTAVADAYRTLLERITPAVLCGERVYAQGDGGVQFSVYKNPDGSTNVYFIATDWHNDDPSGVGTLCLGDERYSINVPYGQLIKVAATDTHALYPVDDKNEVVAIGRDTARVQGVGKSELVLLKNGAERRITVDFTQNSVQTINI